MNTIANTSVASFLQKGFLNVSSLIVTVVLSRLLTVSEFGLFSLVNAIVFFLVIIFSGGIQASMARFIALADDGQYRRDILYKGLSLLLPWILLCTGLYFLLYRFLIDAIFLESPLTELSLVVYGIALVEVVRLFVEKVSHGIGRLGIAAEQSAYSSLLLVVLLVLTAWLVSTAESVLWAKIIALSIPVPFALRKLMFLFREFISTDAPKVPSTKEIARYGLPLSLVSLAAFGFLQADLIFLGRYLDTVSIGLYSICVFTYVRLLLVPRALGNGLAPYMARINQEESWFAYFEKGVFYTLTFSIPVVIIGFFEGAEVLVFVFGEKYREAAGVFRLLSFYFLLSSLLGVVNPILDFSGQAGIRAIGVSLGCVINIILNILLIPIYGMDGAAYATMIGYLAFFIIVVSNIRKGAIIRLMHSRALLRLLLVFLILILLILVTAMLIPDYSTIAVLMFLLFVYPALLLTLKVYTLQDVMALLNKVKR